MSPTILPDARKPLNGFQIEVLLNRSTRSDFQKENAGRSHRRLCDILQFRVDGIGRRREGGILSTEH